MKTFSFELLETDPQSDARCARLTTAHGSVETPVFMPVGTQGSVKGLMPTQLREAGVTMLLGNSYHLALRPGDECIQRLGGLHAFMGWDGPLLTDSGGFQVFSLQDLRKIDDDGVVFRSHVEGRWLELTPERVMRIQENLGADVIMCFDECPPAGADREVIDRAAQRTTSWAKRCKAAQRRTDQALFGIVQGGNDQKLRRRSAEELAELDLPGYAIGGLSVGESSLQMSETLSTTAPLLPVSKPRYLMGVGTPEELVETVARGVDMFDCVMPTRNGRNALAFTSSGKLRLRNARFTDDPAPLDPHCDCHACRSFSRAYLRHLFQANEMLGPILVSLHNIAFYCRLMREIRASIRAGRFGEYRSTALASLQQSP